MRKRLEPPSGAPPPAEASLAGGRTLMLAPLAAEITERYGRAFPDEDERYTPEWRAWSNHDNQHILRWAIDAQRGLADLSQQISWLAGVLAARDFPLDRLARGIELAADVLHERAGDDAEQAVHELRAAAAKLADDAAMEGA